MTQTVALAASVAARLRLGGATFEAPVPSRRVDDILAERPRPANALERLVKRNEAQSAWTKQLRAVLPPNLAPHCRVADIRAGQLIIHVASAAWATRLRFEMPKAEPALRSLMDFAGVEEVRIRTASPASADP